MDGKQIYRLTEGDYTPSGRWDDYPGLMDFRHVASVANNKIRDMDDEAFRAFQRDGRWTVWGGSLEIVSVNRERVTYDSDCEPAEGKYIAVAIQNAIKERRARAR